MMHTVTCRTDGCAYDGVPSSIENPSPLIYCASCGQQITDVSPPVPEPVPDPAE